MDVVHVGWAVSRVGWDVRGVGWAGIHVFINEQMMKKKKYWL